MASWRICSNKRRLWDKKVNKRRGTVAAFIGGIPSDVKALIASL